MSTAESEPPKRNKNVTFSSIDNEKSSLERLDKDSNVEDLKEQTSVTPTDVSPTSRPSSASNTDTPQTPSYRVLLVYILSVVGLWMSESLLGLVDKTFVARTQSVQQVAALAPAVTLCDFVIYSTYFLAIATTNQIAGALAKKTTTTTITASDESERGRNVFGKTPKKSYYRNLQRITSNVLGVARTLGLTLTVMIWGFGRPILRAMIAGSGDADALLLRHASRYVWIRSSALVSSILALVCEAFLLSTLNTKTPLVAMATAFVVNVLGDWWLTPKFGVQGAALATAAASTASCLILLRAVQRQMKLWKQKEFEAVVEVEVAADNTSRLVLEPTKKQNVRMFSWPRRKDAQSLVTLAGPLFFVNLSVMSCYASLVVRSSYFGVLALACHSVLESIFFLFGCFGDATSQAAQSFLPSQALTTMATTAKNSTTATTTQKSRSKLLHQTLLWRRLLVIAMGIGVINSQVSTRVILPRVANNGDLKHIRSLMTRQGRYMGGALLVHPVLLLLEGTLLATSTKMKPLLVSYALSVSFLAARLLFFCPSFGAVWKSLFLFQSFRLVAFLTCVLFVGNNTTRISAPRKQEKTSAEPSRENVS